MKHTDLTSMDENTRRYYLQTMGIQCWELAGKEKSEVIPAGLAPARPSETEPLQESRVTADASNTVAASWRQLQASVQQCELCSLHEARQQMTVATGTGGSKTPLLMVVLLAPDEHGALLTESANALFEKMLAAINLPMNKVYISSLLKCPVPDNHTISVSEIDSCRQYLKQQIQLLQPKQLVVLGETAARCLLQKNMPLDDIRANVNSLQQNIEGVSLLVSYSPEELLLQAENKRKAWTDLQQLQQLLAVQPSIKS